jgi:hypothetical protein
MIMNTTTTREEYKENGGQLNCSYGNWICGWHDEDEFDVKFEQTGECYAYCKTHRAQNKAYDNLARTDSDAKVRRLCRDALRSDKKDYGNVDGVVRDINVVFPRVKRLSENHSLTCQYCNREVLSCLSDPEMESGGMMASLERLYSHYAHFDPRQDLSLVCVMCNWVRPCDYLTHCLGQKGIHAACLSPLLATNQGQRRYPISLYPSHGIAWYVA